MSFESNNNSLNNSRVFDFEGLEESLVDNELNEEFLNEDENELIFENSSQFQQLRDALIRDSINRSEEDLDLIQRFLSIISQQNNSSKSSLLTRDLQTRRLLAKHFVLAEIESRDTRVLTNGEHLDAFCIVAFGSLRHVINVNEPHLNNNHHLTNNHSLNNASNDLQCNNNSNSIIGNAQQQQQQQQQQQWSSTTTQSSQTQSTQVRFYGVGHEFGAQLNDRIVLGEIYTNEDFVWVLCVPHIIYDEICGEKTFQTIKDEISGKIIEIRNKNSELIRVSRERLFELLFQSNESETHFLEDFLLTNRIWAKNEFKTNSDLILKELMEKIIFNLNFGKNLEKNLKIVLILISNHFQDFQNSKSNHLLLKEFESNLKSKIHKKLFYLALSSKSRERQVTITRSDRSLPLPFTLIGGYELSSRLFIDSVLDDSDVSELLQRGDRLITINGIDCHVMEVSRALDLCKSCTHLSLNLKFDPNLYYSLIDGKIQTKHKKSLNEFKTTQNTTQSSLLPSAQQMTTQSSSQTSNNWKQKMRQIVQNVTTNRALPTNTTQGMTTPEVIKIYYESDFRYLPIHVTTTARECIQLALIEFQLNSNYSSRDFALFEYKLIEFKGNSSSMTTSVKRLSDNFQNLAKNLSLNSRLYLKPLINTGNGNTTISEAEITKEIQKEMHVNSLLTLDSEAIARELFERDFELFCRIESQQFVYDLNAEKNFEKVKELKEFEEKTNLEMFWTINQILIGMEQGGLQKRVKIIKQLIRIAYFCQEFNNFNTLFAILSGLQHVTVTRLKSIWDKIPQKSQHKFQKLQQLMDPSKNFQNFRTKLAEVTPPIIPFFPLVKKDLSFIDLANQTFIQLDDNSSQYLINWEKMKLLSSKIREIVAFTNSDETSIQIQQMTTQSISHKKIWDKQKMRKRVAEFLDSSFSSIISDETILLSKSLSIETTQHNTIQRSSISVSSVASASSSSQSSTAATHAMPSPTPSNNSSSPSMSSSSISNENCGQQQRLRLRFGVRDDNGLRKLLALSDNCVDIQSSQSSHLSIANNNFSNNQSFERHFRRTTQSLQQSLPIESSSVTSLRRLEQISQLNRFRDQLIPRMSRPLLPSYDQTIQRMKKSFSNSENVV